jgi:hypothetical protein
MGFQLEKAKGLSVSLKAANAHGAPSAVDLEALLSIRSADRTKWLQENADTKLTSVASEAVKKAESIDDLIVALERRIARGVTPHPVPQGAMILQPSEERRRSGSHYTPRTLTEPIVRKTLEPILDRLGPHPRPEQILALKVADIAVGSGAFLVETCRQLAEALLVAWHHHDCTPPISPDEDELLLAKRTVAQKCLYGVDRNPMAVDLTKLSLWLATLAKHHPFTFLDHCIRCGDSLVGLTRRQIVRFSWSDDANPVQLVFGQDDLNAMVETAAKERQHIIEASDSLLPHQKAEHLRKADLSLGLVRLAGDLCVSAFFEADKVRARQTKREEKAVEFSSAVRSAEDGDPSALDAIKEGVRMLKEDTMQIPVRPFNWEVEFPEVFDRENSGFDAIVGNPPFLGGTRISTVGGMTYFQWLTITFPSCRHLCDLVAYFFRRAFGLLRARGAFGLIATNTISRGDTREGGLRTILSEGGQIYAATRRFKWPAAVSVVVSVVHVVKKCGTKSAFLDGKRVSRISAYLVEGTNDESPARLSANPYFSLGSKIYGQGFIFADGDPDCTPLNVRDELLEKTPNLERRIRPYIGGEEILSHPMQMYYRYVIVLSDLQSEPDLEQWPELRDIVRNKVKPGREILGDNPNNTPLKRKWWAFQAHRPELYRRLASMHRVLATSQVSPQFGFALMPADRIFSHKAVVFCIESYSGFGIIQSRVHEVWARSFSSTSIELMSYTPSDCFETFPFPEHWEAHPILEITGKTYYEFRAAQMVKNDEGLTKTYNRFHDPDEISEDIEHLRELHAAMDVAVVRAYGWEDLVPQCRCEFLLDYEDEDEGDDNGRARKRKKPYCYRWPDEVRDEVLARLLNLNAERAEQERVLGTTRNRSKSPTKRRTRPTEQPTQI